MPAGFKLIGKNDETETYESGTLIVIKGKAGLVVMARGSSREVTCQEVRVTSNLFYPKAKFVVQLGLALNKRTMAKVIPVLSENKAEEQEA